MEARNTHQTSFAITMIPLVLVIGLNALLTYMIFPVMDFSNLQTQFPDLGAVVTLLAICGLTHRQSYLNLAMVTIAIPLCAVVTVIILGTMFGSF